MKSVLVRIAALAIGLGLVEIWLGPGVGAGSLLAWLEIAIGLVLIVAGSVDFMIPLLGSGGTEGRR